MMNQRPTSVTVVSWIMIICGIISFPVVVITINRPEVVEIMAKSPVPIPVQQTLSIVAILVSIISGIFMLRGANWARWLYIVFSGASFVFNFATSPVKLAIIPGLIVYAIVLFFLLQPKANAYFGGQS